MALATSLAGISLASTSNATVTPSPAQPGDDMTVAIHVFGGGWWATDLYLFPSPSVLQSQGHCFDVDGATLVGMVAWTHNADGLNHDAVGQFVLPDVPNGEYVLGLELDYVIPPCFPAGAFVVGQSQAPDTAMNKPGSAPIPWLMAAVLIALLVVAVIRLGAIRNR